MNKGTIKNLLPDYKFQNLLNIDIGLFSNSDLIIFDIDNTLIFPETIETKKEIIGWFNKIKNKYFCLCLSNSKTINKRAEEISKLLDCEIFLSNDKKPFKKLFEKIKGKYNLKDKKIIVIGDRIFTDVLFGNLNGAITILVNPLTNKESILTKIARKLENFILYFFNFFMYNKRR